jgi:serine phosphatase RsbU (regulator of sigma subunit)
MQGNLALLWNRISRIGLLPGEGVQDRREVILLNRIVAILPVVILLYIPLEIYFNGYSLVGIVILLPVLFFATWLLHHYRMFAAARLYSFIIGNVFILVSGLLVGKGVNNQVALIPVVLFGVVLFKTRAGRIGSLVVSSLFYFAFLYLLEIVPPPYFLSPSLKPVFTVIFFMLAMVLNFLLGFYFTGITGEYETVITEQKAAIAEKNKEITDSINYARRIQKAILPSPRMVRECLPDSFVIYSPKDIVSGDFFWLNKLENVTLFAVADCTGHGVPGAMVSVVCNNALNKCVHELDLSEPAGILDRAREIVLNEFEKSDEEIKDGMDISLCALNTAAMQMQWAGANNPLLMIRDGEVIEIKADKQPVGKFHHAAPFTNHSINLKKGDVIYIFSDGYSDQFGGPGGKKLKYKKFRDLLVEHHQDRMDRQKEALLSAFNSWKGDLAQVDDICVMGVRI